MNLNTKDYVYNALKTESNDFPAIQHRLTQENLAIYAELSDILRYYLSALDKFKKLIFYGKGSNQELLEEFVGAENVQVQDFTEQQIRLLHASLGMLTEAGEFADALNANLFENAELDTVNLIEEAAGDNFWYSAIAADACGFDSFDEGMRRNIAKLKARYGDKFSSEAATNRNLTVERNILEGNV